MRVYVFSGSLDRGNWWGGWAKYYLPPAHVQVVRYDYQVRGCILQPGDAVIYDCDTSSLKNLSILVQDSLEAENKVAMINVDGPMFTFYSGNWSNQDWMFN